VDPLKPPTSSKTVAEVCNLLRGDNLPEEDIIHALDALAAAVDFDPWGSQILGDAGLGDGHGLDDLPFDDEHELPSDEDHG
jgi:hypothetical protein